MEPVWAFCYEVSESAISEASKQQHATEGEHVLMSIQTATLAHLLSAPGPLLMLFLLLEMPFSSS